MPTDTPTQPVTIDTGWKTPPTLSDLKQNYDDGKIEHSAQMAKINNWLDHLHVRGKARKPKIKGRSNVHSRLIRKQAEWRYPALSEPFLSTEDIFKVAPVTSQDVMSARQNELVLNYQFNTKINKVKFVDDFVRAGVDEGTIIVRVGWITEEKIVKTKQPIYQFIPDETGRAYKRYGMLVQLQKVNPDKYDEVVDEGTAQAIDILLRTGEAVIPYVIGEEEVEEKILVKNHPTVEVCDSENIIVDPSCNGDLDKAGFIIYTFETNKSELLKSGLYKNLDSIVTTNSDSPTTNPDYKASEDQSTFTFKDTARAKFVAYEYWGYWDINNTGIVEPIVATWVGDVLIRLEVSPFPDKKLPFIFIPHMPVRRSLYGEPDGELLIDNQNIIGAITRGMIDLMGRSAAGQTGTRKDFLDVTNKRKFRDGQDYEFNGNVDPRMGVYQHTYPEIPQSAYNMLNIQNAEAESFSGVKAYNNGITSSSLGDVAAGIRGALDAASRREISILRRLAYGMILIGRKILSLNALLLSEEEVIRVTDEEFVTVKRDDLAGEHDLRLTISTAEEDNAKAQELAFMLQTGAASADPGEVRMIRAEIARLRKMPALAKRIEEYQPQPDPIAQQKAMLEMLLLRAQIQRETAAAAVDQSEANLNAIKSMTEQADSILTMAKATTEKAKARQIMSAADKTDLDYLEQESGVKQTRDLQKIHGQAESQTRMKVVEALLDKTLNKDAVNQ